jgi:hypothetical protein
MHVYHAQNPGFDPQWSKHNPAQQKPTSWAWWHMSIILVNWPLPWFLMFIFRPRWSPSELSDYPTSIKSQKRALRPTYAMANVAQLWRHPPENMPSTVIRSGIYSKRYYFDWKVRLYNNMSFPGTPTLMKFQAKCWHFHAMNTQKFSVPTNYPNSVSPSEVLVETKVLTIYLKYSVFQAYNFPYLMLNSSWLHAERKTD